MFQKNKGKIESVLVNVKKIGKRQIILTDGYDEIEIQSQFNLDSSVIMEGPELTVIAMYIYKGQLFPLGTDDAINVEESDARFLSNQMRGKIYSDPKINALLQEQQQYVNELKKLLEEKQLLTKLDAVVGTAKKNNVIDLSKL